MSKDQLIYIYAIEEYEKQCEKNLAEFFTESLITLDESKKSNAEKSEDYWKQRLELI